MKGEPLWVPGCRAPRSPVRCEALRRPAGVTGTLQCDDKAARGKTGPRCQKPRMEPQELSPAAQAQRLPASVPATHTWGPTWGQCLAGLGWCLLVSEDRPVNLCVTA